MIYRRKRKWIGHVVRGDGLIKLIMEGRLKESFPQGKPRIGMLDIVKPKFTRSKNMLLRRCKNSKGML